MNNKPETTQDATKMRQHAERQIVARDAATGGQPDAKRLVHELQIHQIELEMQNEALRESRTTAEIAMERYAELFDFAPIAYFVLGADGIIRQTNFRGEDLLGLIAVIVRIEYANRYVDQCLICDLCI